MTTFFAPDLPTPKKPVRSGGTKAGPRPSQSAATKETDSEEKQPTIWEKISPAQQEEIESLAAEYRNFLTEAKTERAVNKYVLDKAKDAGYDDMAKADRLTKGGYLTHHGKLVGLFEPGRDYTQGFNLLVTHGDSPRLDLKPRCLYQDGGLGLLKSNLYGGLKKYQWLARPLALWGFCVLKDGRKVEFRFGDEPGDPVLTVTDILPHLDSKVQRDKKLTDAFPAERLNVLAASTPSGPERDKTRLKTTIRNILWKRWGLKEDDLISSEIELVPAGPAREVGLDGSLIGGYGQDDRLSVFLGLKALLAQRKPEKPLLMIVFDREEIGSFGSTGAESNFVTRLASGSLALAGHSGDWRQVTETLASSRAISADVEAALDPTFKEVYDELNAAHLGLGPCLTRYTGGVAKYGASEARAEYMARIRKIFDDSDITWQNTLLGKQEYGGGGTVALCLAFHGLSVVDCGAPVLSMHSPFEITSKADIWMTMKAYQAFYQKA
ncbi:MAG: aminopeptidase [Deltaproteobacteria bacterium]|nr:aminopeptidase [Deltaproteobacteria bacterium]